MTCMLGTLFVFVPLLLPWYQEYVRQELLCPEKSGHQKFFCCVFMWDFLCFLVFPAGKGFSSKLCASISCFAK